MSAMYDSLKRGSRYTFVFGSGVDAISGVFHEYLSDGSLLVAGSSKAYPAAASQYRINPSLVMYVREES